MSNWMCIHTTCKPPAFLPGFKNPCWYDVDDDRREAWMERVCESSTSMRNTACPYYPRRKVKKKTRLLRCLPYFMLIGQPKSGSTDLFYRIVEHPDVLPGINKEPHWFSRHRHCQYSHLVSCDPKSPHTFTEYVDYFHPAAQKIHDSSDEQRMELITGEGSQSTLWDHRWWWLFPGNKNDEEPKLLNAHFVRHILPDVKLVVILRDPVDRLYSDYLYFKAVQNKSVEDFHSRAQRAVATFNDCMMRHSLRYCAYRVYFADLRLTVGLYVVFLEDWMTVFPRKQFFITALDDYSKNQTMVASNLFKFLDLSDVDGNEPKRTRLNKRKPSGRQVGDMLTETRLLLKQLYKPFNHALSTLLEDPIFLWGT
ncbi:carbohydrate sulfotransferase 15-like [Argopecten irradians]|uniref:carbohydrate sulfotransferase 15-like n=1 Tax=Argopecten irradians TaxID=31199 RepID=UPI003719AE15